MSPTDDSETQARASDETAAQPVELLPDSTVRFTPGKLLAGRYRIIAPLGKGGMGEVYRADDTRLGQPVALKFLPAAFASDPAKLERLVDEVRLGRQIAHPNVCRLYDIAEAEGHHFMVMEYVDGEDLASLLRRIGRLPGDKALEIARGVCAGLAAAHDKGIIHRDLKPANVMIDGRGHARIADFGLAALAGSSGTDMSGTPQYMAPEQLTGQGASLRSDVYALGLVMHEMLTGKRVFDAKSMGELRALHAESKPLSLPISATDVDPGLERVVQRCLSRDPNDRPASARVVLLSLPGGDPLQAAVLAGETPSPEMVAAAAKVGDLRASVAWACLLSGLMGLAVVAWLSARSALYHVTPLLKPPEALVERGKEVLARLGYLEAPVDDAYGLVVDHAALDHARTLGDSASWWSRIATTRPGPYVFYYRQSPTKLWSRSWIPTLPNLGPAELGRVTRVDPPLTLPGMKEILLDVKGRLRRVIVVPPRYDDSDAATPDPDWSVAIAEAGFESATLRASRPMFTAPVDTDRKAAWDGVDPENGQNTVHFEAASFHGRLVYFEVQGPWELRARPAAAASGTIRVLAGLTFAGFLLAILLATPVLVRRNLRLGRGDRRGALRLGMFGFVTLGVAQLFRASHTSEALPEFTLLLQILGQALCVGVGVWLAYLAMEPSVRRQWPNALISWSRLLAGRYLDPIVGRDVLVGLLTSLAIVAEFQTARLASLSFGSTPIRPQILTDALSSPWHVAHYVFLSPVVALVQSLLLVFFLYLIHRLVGRAWGAHLIFMLLFAVVSLGTFLTAATPAIPTVLLVATLPLFLAFLFRYGLLSSTVFLTAFYVLVRTPMTLDWSDWYAGRCFFVLGSLAVLIAASAYISLGGKPVFGKALLDE